MQTTKSLTWRRRHFTLFAHEMQLFKSEGVSRLVILHSFASLKLALPIPSMC